MKRTFAVIAFTLFFSCAFAQVEITPTEADFGRRPQNQAFTQSLKLTNTGPVPLKIVAVDGDCSCTTATAGATSLAPGESTPLTVRMESGSGEGALYHNVLISLSTGGRITVPVRMIVYHYANWILSPPRMLLPPGSNGTATRADLHLNYLGEGPIGSISATADSPWIHLDLKSMTAKEAVYEVERLPDAPNGPLYGSIRVTTPDKESPVLVVPLFAYVEPAVTVDPNPIVILADKAGQPASATAKVSGWTGKNPLRAEFPDGAASLMPGPDNTSTVTVSIPAASAGMTVHTLTLSDGGKSTTQVTVIVRTGP